MRTIVIKHKLITILIGLLICISTISGIIVFSDTSSETIVFHNYIISAPKKEQLTGEDAKITVSVSQSDDVLRMYFRCDDSDYENFRYSSNATANSGVPVTIHKVDDEDNCYYYEIGPMESGGQTVSIDFTFYYPNGSSGGDVEWWFAAATEDVFDEMDGKLLEPGTELPDNIEIHETTFKSTWNTDEAHYDIEKTADPAWSMYFTEDGNAAVKNLSYQIEFADKDYKTENNNFDAELGGYRNYGADFVEYVEYEDILKLPDNLIWRDGLETAAYRTEGGGKRWSVYAKIAGTDYLVATIVITDSVQSVSVQDVGCEYKDGNVVLKWRVNNTKNINGNGPNSGEIENVITQITYGPEVIIYKDYDGKARDLEFDLENTVTADLNYFCKENPYTSEAVVKDTKKTDCQGSLYVKKERITPTSGTTTGKDGYYLFGEDVDYVITTHNESPFDYTKYAAVTDNLDEYHYIKSENMLRMFDEAKTAGEDLEIVITHASLVSDIITKEVTGTDGISTATTGTQNTGDDTTYTAKAVPKNVKDGNATLTISYVDNALTLRVSSNGEENIYQIGDGYSYASIDDAFQSIGYDITSTAVYTVNWYKDDKILKKGSTRTYNVYATFKDTFMLLNEDNRKLYGNPDKFTVDWNDIKRSTKNTAHVKDQKNNKTSPKSDDTPDPVDIRPEFQLQKGFSVENADYSDSDSSPMFADGSVLQFHVLVHHSGSSAYDVLPVTDQSTGAQAMMVKASENEGAEWIGHALEYWYNGELYYVLVPPENGGTYTYKGVWVSGYFVDPNSVRMYYADSVTVTRETDEDRSITTLAKWYLTNTDGTYWDANISYKTISDRELLGCGAHLKAAVDNWAYINDRDGHRLYDYKGGVSFQFDFDKNIVTKKYTDNPLYDALDQDKFTLISQNSTEVTYRLDFSITGDGSLTLTGQDFYDSLPNNAGFFSWDNKGSDPNVKVSYLLTGETCEMTFGGETYKTTDGRLEMDSPGTEFTITGSDNGSASQNIRWNRDFRFTINHNIKNGNQDRFYIYITLTFPGGDDDTVWKDYLQTNNDAGNLYLYNTLYVEDWPIEVSHQLTDPGKAFLQKGVYETGIYTTKNSSYNESTATYFKRDDRNTYINNIESAFRSNNLKSQTITRGSVAYYILLKNSSDTNLYINTIYDVLPKGFEYLSIRNNIDGDASYTGVGHTNYIYSMGSIHGVRDSWRQPLVGTGAFAPSDYRNNKDWVPYSDNAVKFICSSGGVIDGHRILCIDISMSNPNADIAGIGYDPVSEKYYLKPGYYIQFGYEVTTGLESESEDIACNAAAMPLADIDAELSLDDDTPVAVNTQKNAAPANDGARYLWDNDTAVQNGFASKGADTRWLASDVTVRRGNEIIPGIEKTVAPEEDHPEANEPVHWKIKAYNEGTALMDNYQIVDTIQAPYHFTGNITYKNYTTNTYVSTTNSNKIGLLAQNSSGYLLHIDRNNNGDTISLTSNCGDAASLILTEGADGYGEPVVMRFNITHEDITEEVPAKVSITQTNLTETLTIIFEDPRWNITSKGYVELGYETTNTTGIFTILEKITNEATLIPSDAYDEASVTKGTNIKDGTGNNIGVSDDAYISIGVAEPTNSYKEVDEIEVDGQEGYAHSEDGNNRIIVEDKTHIFRYTLNVESSASYDMDQLVIIDNLPENDDSNTLFGQPRGSAFTVSVLKNNPDFEVLVYTEKDGDTYINPQPLSPKQYEVQYKISDSSGDFDHGDWSGGQRDDAGDDRGEDWDKWLTYIPGTTSADDLAAARDIRLIVRGLNDDDTVWIPKDNETLYTAPKTPALAKNSKLSFSFNAVIENPDEEADYGDIAWNTFGYEYFIGVINDKGDMVSHYLYAAPSRVGISIPAVPVLSKSIVNSSGRSANAADNKTFAFIIYEGETVDFSDYTPETVAQTLANNSRSFTYVTLTVKEGESVSESVKLGDLKKYTYSAGEFTQTDDDWVWEEAQEGAATPSGRYSIVELDTDSEYSYSSTKVGSAVSNNRNVSFDYTRLYNLVLEYSNSVPSWGVDLFKVDESNPNTRLQGAIFGLYSPNSTDLISDDDLEIWEFTSDDIAKTITYDGTTYYLSKIAETGDDGRIAAWMSGLEETSYVIIELKAPEGYISSTAPIFVEYSSEYIQNPCKISVSNIGGKAPASVKVNLGLTKTVNVPDDQNYDGGSFTFAIIPDDDNPASDPLNILPRTVTVTVPDGSDSVSATGTIFNNVDFTESGTYKYRIYETKDNADSRIIYDTSVYDVTITVTETGNMYGDDYQLEAAITVTKTVDGEEISSDVNSIEFINTFKEISLPNTGGAGVYPFCIGGALLALAALFLGSSNTKKRMERL